MNTSSSSVTSASVKMSEKQYVSNIIIQDKCLVLRMDFSITHEFNWRVYVTVKLNIFQFYRITFKIYWNVLDNKWDDLPFVFLENSQWAQWYVEWFYSKHSWRQVRTYEIRNYPCGKYHY